MKNKRLLRYFFIISCIGSLSVVGYFVLLYREGGKEGASKETGHLKMEEAVIRKEYDPSCQEDL